MSKIKHIALIQFKAETSEEQIQKLFDEVLDITEAIPGIEDYVSGANNSPEGLNHGCTHGFVMTFTDATARDGYLANSEQQRIKGLLNDAAQTQIVFDFEI